MPTFNEQSVENYFVNKLQSNDWLFVPADELERESMEEPLLVNNLLRALKRLNAGSGLGDEEIKQVLNELKLAGSGYEGVKKILNFIKQGVPIKFEKEKVVKYVKLIGYKTLNNNEFIVSRQVRYRSGDKNIIADIVLYVNGIPLVIIECKNPVDFSVNWYDAYLQIKDYEKSIPELFKYAQIGVVAEAIAKYFPIVPWLDEVRTYEWKEDLKDSIDSTIELLSREKLLDVIQNFLFSRIEGSRVTKVIARYMQYRAVQKVFNRVLDHLDGKDPKNRGLVWHWQGSGKTLTMIFAAHKLYNQRELENPTVFFIVDRIELEEQLRQEFDALDITKSEVIGSINDLRKTIAHDSYKGKRGIFITLVHKFRTDELHQLQKEIEAASKTNETISTRKNVIAFVDEGHRTQEGMLGAEMRSILKSAFLFAFTGTPIESKFKSTYRNFSYPPKEKHLDRYFITDSIKDGFTVKIAYQPRLEKEVNLKRDMLETFLRVEFEEIPEELKGKIEERVKKRLSAIKLFLQNPKRIRRVSEDIALHFKDNLDGKFKAMVVAVNRESCVHYKRVLDQVLPKEYSEIVMTFNEKDHKVIKDYCLELRSRFPKKEDGEIRKEIVDKFKEENLPKILIVTDMLLTGFDAPILQTMYLDKPMKEHKLLQAIARTNRPYKDIKEAGLVIDYVGILKDFKKAFELYSKDEIKGALYDMEALRKEFLGIVEEILGIFKGIDIEKTDRDTLLKAIEILTTNEENSKQFLTKYKKLRNIFELLGPDEVKVKMFSQYKWISAVYVFYSRLVRRSEPDARINFEKYFNKTMKYVYETTELEKLEKDLPLIPFDDKYLSKLEEKFKTKEEKAANIVFTLNRLVLVDKHKAPVYESLVDKVDRLVRLWKDKTMDLEKIYKEGLDIINEIQKLSDRQKHLGFSDMEYSILLTLEKEFGHDKQFEKDSKELSQKLTKLMFGGWLFQQTTKKSIERELRSFLRKYVNERDLSLDDLDKLYQTIIESVKSYGKAN